ncbi:hypothetical protein NQ314_008330 [Rhamnusium bicolor]|uniref:Uncharacterized protein n=1 Tax=Rhamnusium bicolor TaxID=1586634 RepID=A0AAV8YEM5_9CUCU|nr:hypothetical protein NQ314_008330 [Rhamnusium bicolor]
MPPMNASYSKLESPLPPPPPPPASSVHTNYMQPNPLAQLQQQAEMWHNYQDDMRPRSSDKHKSSQQVIGAKKSIYDARRSTPFQHQPSPPLSIPSPMMMDKHRQTPHALHQVNSTSLPMTPPLSNISMTPPHSNENVPPDETLHHQHIGKTITEETFESKHIIDSVQPLMENNNMQHEPFMPVYGQSVVTQSQFEKIEDVKMKKPPVPPQIRASTKKPSPKPLPDFNEAFGSTERGRFQSPPDPRLAPNKGYLDFFYEDSSQIKFDDFQM